MRPPLLDLGHGRLDLRPPLSDVGKREARLETPTFGFWDTRGSS